MVRKEVTKYALYWDFTRKEGGVGLRFEPGNWSTLGLSGSEMNAIGTMLREEAPIFFDTEKKLLMTREEIVGEGE